MDHDGTKRSKLADTTIYHSNEHYMDPLMIRSVKLGLLRDTISNIAWVNFHTEIMKNR